MPRADHGDMRSLDDRPQLTLRQETAKADPRLYSELGCQRLNLASQGILADDVEAEIAAAVREQAQRAQQKRLILHAVEACDMHESRRLVLLPTDRAPRGPVL